MEAVDDQDLALAFDRRPTGLHDERLRFFVAAQIVADRIEHVDVGVRLVDGESAVTFGVVGIDSSQQLTGEDGGGPTLPGATRTDEQIGVDGCRDRSFETTNRLLLTDDEIPAHGFAANHASTAVSTRAATSSTVPSASTTNQRSGSAAASSRYPFRTRVWKAAPAPSMRSI